MVEQDETVEISDGRRPLARLSGDVEPGAEGVDDLPEPLVLAPGRESPSAALERLRRHER